MFSLGIARGNRRFPQQPTAVSRAGMKMMELHTNSVTWDNKLQLEIEAWEIQAGYLQKKKISSRRSPWRTWKRLNHHPLRFSGCS